MAFPTYSHGIRRVGIHRVLVRILPLALLILSIQTFPLHASMLADTADNLETKRSMRDVPFEQPFDPMDLDLQLRVLAGYTVFFEEDMGDTYGCIPSVSVEASLGASERIRFVFGLGYGSTTGDPHYDSPEFEGGNDLRLRLLPVTVGLRANSSRNQRFRLDWGASFEAVWMEERIPDIDESSGAPYRNDRGWGKGIKFTLSPEWLSRDRRHALGLTFTWGGSSGEVGKGYKDHEVSLMGMGASLHYTRAL